MVLSAKKSDSHPLMNYWSDQQQQAPPLWTYFCWSVGFWMMVFSPSITCCFSWWDSMPASNESNMSSYILLIDTTDNQRAWPVPSVHRHWPSIGEHLKDFAILFQASVTCVFWERRHNDVYYRRCGQQCHLLTWSSWWESFTWFPGLTRRRAASAQRWAALITSAFLPVCGLS